MGRLILFITFPPWLRRRIRRGVRKTLPTSRRAHTAVLPTATGQLPVVHRAQLAPCYGQNFGMMGVTTLAKARERPRERRLAKRSEIQPFRRCRHVSTVELAQLSRGAKVCSQGAQCAQLADRAAAN